MEHDGIYWKRMEHNGISRNGLWLGSLVYLVDIAHRCPQVVSYGSSQWSPRNAAEHGSILKRLPRGAVASPRSQTGTPKKAYDKVEIFCGYKMLWTHVCHIICHICQIKLAVGHHTHDMCLGKWSYFINLKLAFGNDSPDAPRTFTIP